MQCRSNTSDMRNCQTSFWNVKREIMTICIDFNMTSGRRGRKSFGKHWYVKEPVLYVAQLLLIRTVSRRKLKWYCGSYRTGRKLSADRHMDGQTATDGWTLRSHFTSLSMNWLIMKCGKYNCIIRWVISKHVWVDDWYFRISFKREFEGI